MSLTKLFEKHITAILLGAAMCFAFFAIGVFSVQAEETDDEVVIDDVVGEEVEDEGVSDDEDVDDSEKRTKMMDQIESLRALIAEKKSEVKEEWKEEKEELKEEAQEKREEFKADKVEFMASLEGLSEEEKKEAMMEFITNLKDLILAKKAEQQQIVEARKEANKEAQQKRLQTKEEFQSGLEGLSKDEKIAAILERLEDLKDIMSSDEEVDEETEV